MHARYIHSRFQVALLCIMTLAVIPNKASASFIITFEDATGIPNVPFSTSDISNTFKDAYGGSNTVHGVTFDDNFSVFSSNYTNGVGGNDHYGPTDGLYAITNTAGGGTADTGPNNAGLEGLTLTTNAVLQSASFAANDYGNGNFGADSVTVTAIGKSGDLAFATLLLVDNTTDENPIAGLSSLNTAAVFNPFAGQITGYRIDSTLTNAFAALGSGGGNYVADDFVFNPPPTNTAVPEPSAPAALSVGAALLGGLVFFGRRRSHHRSH